MIDSLYICQHLLMRTCVCNIQVRLVDAAFVWTEPHSKRVKVKLSIQKEVLSGAVLQQVGH